ncbi:hypothetical protein FANTH_13417 [Fusarium anthophilum]|uniref:Uncharacterized protein n=1 Tax=Fusarium anthophilum TaxID=48485 RepID=A0A8H4YNT8_9HYPO|nr:hypothetical protein FANTH_13417 [Fusarium anthophilum]
MANNSLLDNLQLFQLFFDTIARLLICTKESCKFALSNGPSRVTTHLREKDPISTEARNRLNQLLKSLSSAPLELDDASPRAYGSPEHDKLRVYEGFACTNYQCRTINLPLARRHQSNSPDNCCDPGARSAGPHRRLDFDPKFEYVYLQTWTTGPTQKHWIIKQGGTPGVMTVAPLAQPADMTAFPLQTPWLDRTDWDRRYSSRGRREVLAALTRAFTSLGERDYCIGHGQRGVDKDPVSLGEDEDRIACLVRLVDVMMYRYVEKARMTSRHMLCWLRSTQASSM